MWRGLGEGAGEDLSDGVGDGLELFGSVDGAVEEGLTFGVEGFKVAAFGGGGDGGGEGRRRSG